MSSLNIQKFINSISNDDLSYKTFSMNKKYKEIYVEGYDDKVFYKDFLSSFYDCSPVTTDFVVCRNKNDVLASSASYTGNKNRYIVDLDYLPFDVDYYENIAVTTGYSMENFIFYKHNGRYNFEFLFEKIYEGKYSLMISRLNDFKKMLVKYKKQSLYYFAFFKTSMEIKNEYEIVKIHKNINLINYSEEDVLKEINDMHPARKELFLNRYNQNKKILLESDYMLLRGHDLFDRLYNFLKTDFNTLTKTELYHLAGIELKLRVPEKFKLYFK